MCHPATDTDPWQGRVRLAGTQRTARRSARQRVWGSQWELDSGIIFYTPSCCAVDPHKPKHDRSWASDLWVHWTQDSAV